MRIKKGENIEGLYSGSEVIARGARGRLPYLNKVLEDIKTDVLLIPASYITDSEINFTIDPMTVPIIGTKLNGKALGLGSSFLQVEDLEKSDKKLLGYIRDLSRALHTAEYRYEIAKSVSAETSSNNLYSKDKLSIDEINDIKEKYRLIYFGNYDKAQKKYTVTATKRPIIGKVQQAISSVFVLIPLEGTNRVPELSKAQLVTHEIRPAQFKKIVKLFSELLVDEKDKEFVDKYELPIFKLKRLNCETAKIALSEFNLDIYTASTSKLNPDNAEDELHKAGMIEDLRHLREDLLPTTFETLKEQVPLNKSQLTPRQVLSALQQVIKSPNSEHYAALLSLLGTAQLEEDSINIYEEDDKYTIQSLYRLLKNNLIVGPDKYVSIDKVKEDQLQPMHDFLLANDLIQEDAEVEASKDSEEIEKEITTAEDKSIKVSVNGVASPEDVNALKDDEDEDGAQPDLSI